MTEKNDLSNTARTSGTFAFLTFRSLTLCKRNLLQKTEDLPTPQKQRAPKFLSVLL